MSFLGYSHVGNAICVDGKHRNQYGRRTFLRRAAVVAGGLHQSLTTNAAEDTFPFIDSHQHFWNPSEIPTPAPPPKAASVLGRAFLPKDLHDEISSVGVRHTVLVQGLPQIPQYNRWLFDRARQTAFVAGVVAWMDLERPDAGSAAILQLRKEAKFVGIRHIVNREPDRNWILRSPVLASLRTLAAHGVPFDMVVNPEHLRNVIRLFEKAPELHLVMDHLGNPDIAAGGSPEWKELLAEIAKQPHAYCKISGMITQADWQKWTVSDLKPYVQHAVEVFGWNRVMFGSDWPVCLLAGTYRQVWRAANQALGDMTMEQRQKVFGANAIRFYGLKVKHGA
jgi:L-fuconolactonase